MVHDLIVYDGSARRLVQLFFFTFGWGASVYTWPGPTDPDHSGARAGCVGSALPAGSGEMPGEIWENCQTQPAQGQVVGARPPKSLDVEARSQCFGYLDRSSV